MRFLWLIAMITWPAIAIGQPAGAQAEVLFREGRSLITAGKYAEACAAFEQSQKLEPSLSTLLNLGDCREKNGQIATAWGLFLDAERQSRSGTDAATQQLHGVAQSFAKKLEPRISKLAINVPDSSRVDGLEIKRDNEAIDPVMWNRALPIDGGTYTITARAPGTSSWSTKVTVSAERDTQTVEIPDLRGLPHESVRAPGSSSTVPSPSSAQTGDVAVAAPKGGKPLAAYALGGSAVLLVGAAVGLSFWGDATYADAKAETTDQARRNSLFDSANTKRYAAEGLAVAGIGCAGLAVWLFLRHDSKESVKTASGPQVVLSPNGLSVFGVF